MSHYKLNTPDHLAAARPPLPALTQLRALMADPANAETWAKDEDTKALLKEAEALIDPPTPPLP